MNAKARRIDPAFTSLMQMAVQLLPGSAPFTRRDDLACAIIEARLSADLARWPAACIHLLEACEQIGAGRKDALRDGEIGRASSAEWPAPQTNHNWQTRADIGDGAESFA